MAIHDGNQMKTAGPARIPSLMGTLRPAPLHLPRRPSPYGGGSLASTGPVRLPVSPRR